MFTSGLFSLNCSAAAVLSGATVDEPSMVIVPDRFDALEPPVVSAESLLPQAARVSEPPATARAASDAYMRRDVIVVSLGFIRVAPQGMGST